MKLVTSQQPPKSLPSNSYMAAKLFIGLVLILVMATFAAVNNNDVEFTYYFGISYKVKLWWVVLGSFGIGLLLAGTGWFVTFIKLIARTRSLDGKVSALEKELKALRQKPLPDEPSVYPTVIRSEPANLALSPSGKGELPPAQTRHLQAP